jgi:putative intracellular protease/amidase
MLIAVVVYDGVLDDECEAFRSVLALVFDARVITVGAQRGTYTGVGGLQHVDATFDEIDAVDVVVVPGGLGCERAADDPVLRQFLLRMERTARFVAASSTGSVVLASAGLLHGRAAATHWLATDLLRRYGSETDPRGLVVTDKIVTCEGRISAVDAALALAERLEGPAAVERIRATLLERGEPLLRPPSRWALLSARWSKATDRHRRRRDAGRQTNRPAAHRAPRSAQSAARIAAHVDRSPTPRPPIQPAPDTPPPITPISVMIELVDNEQLKRQLKRRSAGRRRRRSRR